MTFDDFWNAWPRHHRRVNRKACERHWTSNNLAAQAADILKGLELSKASAQWKKDGGMFIPAPLVWLHQERWTAMLELETPQERAAALIATGAEEMVARRRRMVEEARSALDSWKNHPNPPQAVIAALSRRVAAYGS